MISAGAGTRPEYSDPTPTPTSGVAVCSLKGKGFRQFAETDVEKVRDILNSKTPAPLPVLP